MELPRLGQQCAHTACKQLDFLPLLCKCGKKFCSEHFNIHVEECETTVNLEREEKRKISDVFKCSREDCKETSIVPLICQRCRQHFCIKHRHLAQCFEKDEKTLSEEKEKFAAPVRQFNEAKVAVDKQIEKNLLEAKKKGKKTNLVNKVQLMKIKNKAKGLGSIPVVDRVYFNVSSPGNQGNPLFVSKAWSLGRAIDAIADGCSLKNDNNKSGSKKLRLFKHDTNEILSTNLAETLDALISTGVIVDGDNLVIAYVDDNQTVLSP